MRLNEAIDRMNIDEALFHGAKLLADGISAPASPVPLLRRGGGAVPTNRVSVGNPHTVSPGSLQATSRCRSALRTFAAFAAREAGGIDILSLSLLTATISQFTGMVNNEMRYCSI